MIDNEFLIELEEFPKYFVGVDGVYSDKFGKMKKLKAFIDCDGYYRVGLYKDCKPYPKTLHRLIAQTFIPNPYNLHYVDHINHNPLDNRLVNLRWISNRNNLRNSSMSKKNTSGFQGVVFKKDRWSAQWYNNEGKQKEKSFSIKNYGEKAKQLAIDYRQKMVDELYNRPEIVT